MVRQHKLALFFFFKESSRETNSGTHFTLSLLLYAGSDLDAAQAVLPRRSPSCPSGVVQDPN